MNFTIQSYILLEQTRIFLDSAIYDKMRYFDYILYQME